MSSQTLEMSVIGLDVKVSFDYQPVEHQSWDSPGEPESFDFWELLVKDHKGDWQDCSAMLESEWVCEKIEERLLELREIGGEW